MPDYTLSVRGEFKDDISGKLSGVSDTVAGFKDNLKNATSGALTFGDVLKANLLSDAIMNGLSRLKDGLVSAGKAAYEQGAALEQSIGGIETLFKDNADTVKKYADEAYKTAGLSANEYMESVTGFSASLLQSLGGDTEKAAEAANQAIIDMSDNANKMGTSMDSIKNAYAGFAKQNYTMLDNLKLGYGGTKEEMERLLADAEKISGVHYDITNLSDVYSAIHVIQGELDITGTTAKEASKTLSGSFAAMGSAWQNLLGKITIGEDISDEVQALKDSVGTFFENLLPAIGNMIDALPDVLSGIFDTLGDLMEQIYTYFVLHEDALIEAGKTLINGIINGITTFGPDLVTGALSLVVGFGQAIIESAPQLLSAGQTMLQNLIDGITSNFQSILETGGSIIQNLVQGILNGISTVISSAGEILMSLKDTITENLPTILETGKNILDNIINGILDAIPELITTAGELLNQFVDFWYDNWPTILDTGVEIVLNLVKGITEHLPDIAHSVVEIITKIGATILEHLPEITQKGIEIIGKLAKGLIEAIPDIVKAIAQVIKDMVKAFMEFDWIGLGKDILAGIGKGLKDLGGNIWSGIKNTGGKIADGFKDFFDIGSPSRLMADEVGKYIPEGIAVGIDGNTSGLEKSIGRLNNMVLSDVSDVTGSTNSGGYGFGATNNYNYGGFNLSVYGAEGQDENTLADIIEARIRARMNAEEAVFA